MRCGLGLLHHGVYALLARGTPTTLSLARTRAHARAGTQTPFCDRHRDGVWSGATFLRERTREGADGLLRGDVDLPAIAARRSLDARRAPTKPSNSSYPRVDLPTRKV
jgi:hypothetical protein